MVCNKHWVSDICGQRYTGHAEQLSGTRESDFTAVRPSKVDGLVNHQVELSVAGASEMSQLGYGDHPISLGSTIRSQNFGTCPGIPIAD